MSQLGVPSSRFLLHYPQLSGRSGVKTLILAGSHRILRRAVTFSAPLNASQPRRAGVRSEAFSAIPSEVEEIVERDFSFLDPNPSDVIWISKARRTVSAAGIRPGSKVVAALPVPAFVDQIIGSSPLCELVAAVHESLTVLAAIKEAHDRVRCWHGGIEAVPDRLGAFDSVFLCYFPAMRAPIDEVLRAISRRCSQGARVLISYEGGRETVEREHRHQFPDLVTADLPRRNVLDKAAAEHSFRVNDFVDDPDYYLAVLLRL